MIIAHILKYDARIKEGCYTYEYTAKNICVSALLKIKLRRFYTTLFVPCPHQITPFLHNLQYYARITPFLRICYTKIFYADFTTFLHNTFLHFTRNYAFSFLRTKIDRFIEINFCPFFAWFRQKNFCPFYDRFGAIFF